MRDWYTSGQGPLFPESLFLLCFLPSSNQSHSVCNSFSLCEVPNKLRLSSRNCWLPLGFCNRPHPQLENVSGENLPSNPFNESLGTLSRKFWVAFISLHPLSALSALLKGAYCLNVLYLLFFQRLTLFSSFSMMTSELWKGEEC